MTVSNMTDEEKSFNGAGATFRLIAASVSVLFFSGVLMGFARAMLQKEQISEVGYAKLAAICALLAASLWYATRSFRRYLRKSSPDTPRARRAMLAIWSTALIGALMGLTISFASDHPAKLFHSMDGPIPPFSAASLIAVFLFVVAPITYFWHRNIDEHEEASYRTGALLALYFYGGAAPIWWLGERGGFLPPVDGAILYFATMGVWGIVWFRQRYL